MLKKNEKGFSLVELMLVAAGLAGLAYVGMQMTKTQIKSVVKGQLDSDILLTTNEIVGILSDPAKCMATLGGKNALSTTSGINAINSTFYYSAASGSAPAGGYGNSNLQITSYALNATSTEVGNKTSYLIINYQNKNVLKGSSGASSVAKKVGLYVEVDSGQNITKCRSLANSSTDIWSRGAGSNIFYSGGRVGIGTSAPGQNLNLYDDSSYSVLRINSPIASGFNSSIQFYDLTNKGFSLAYSGVADPAGHSLVLGWDQSENLLDKSIMTFKSDVRVGIGTSTPVTTLDVKPTGNLCPSGGTICNDFYTYVLPANWGGGIHTWDVYANGSLGVGVEGNLSAVITSPKNHATHSSVSATMDCPTGWSCTGHFYDVSLSRLQYNQLQMRSDLRLKKDIHTLDGSITEKIKGLRPVEFKWKDSSLGSESKYGLIAQEVYGIFPEITKISNDAKKIMSIDYVSLISPLIRSVQELFKANDQMEQEVSALREEIALLKKEMAVLKQEKIKR